MQQKDIFKVGHILQNTYMYTWVGDIFSISLELTTTSKR